MFGVELARLLEDPTFSMGMICRFIRGAVDLTYFVQNLVQAGEFVSVAFRGQLLLTWPRASKSCVYRRALRAIFFIPVLVFAASWLPVSIPDFGCTWVVGATSG